MLCQQNGYAGDIVGTTHISPEGHGSAGPVSHLDHRRRRDHGRIGSQRAAAGGRAGLNGPLALVAMARYWQEVFVDNTGRPSR